MTPLNSLPDLVKAMTATAEKLSAPKPSLIDTRGLCRPTSFNNDEQGFQRWAQKQSSYVDAVCPELASILEWSVDQTDAIEMADILAEFGPSVDEITRVEGCVEFTSQMFAAMLQLTEGESHDIVVNANKNPYESWRRLHRRFDPATGGRKGNLFASHHQPAAM